MIKLIFLYYWETCIVYLWWFLFKIVIVSIVDNLIYSFYAKKFNIYLRIYNDFKFLSLIDIIKRLLHMNMIEWVSEIEGSLFY